MRTRDNTRPVSLVDYQTTEYTTTLINTYHTRVLEVHHTQPTYVRPGSVPTVLLYV